MELPGNGQLHLYPRPVLMLPWHRSHRLSLNPGHAMILCLSHTQDFYTIDIVQNAFRELGHDVYRLNTDDFSQELTFSYASQPDRSLSFTLHTRDRSFSSSDVSGVWYRKLWGVKPPPELDPQFQSIFYQEYTTMRDLFFDALRHVPWMNPIAQDHWIGGNKALQLELARRNGLEIPESLFTNDPEQVRHFFYETCKGQMITKLHGTLSRSMSGDTPFFPTTQVAEQDLEQLTGLPYCPMIFQELVPKAYELRIVYVDGEFFAGKIDASSSARGRTDWRIASDIPLVWQAYTLPEDIAGALDRMMKEMGLLFGAIDVIRHTDGRYIFLEVNPQGEWGMLQRDLGYAIGQTIASKLSARIPTTQPLMN